MLTTLRSKTITTGFTTWCARAFKMWTILQCWCYRFIYALSLITLRRLRQDNRLQLSPILFRLQWWLFQGWGWRVPPHRSRGCKSTRTKCNSSCTWKIPIALGCSPHVTTSSDGWQRYSEWRQEVWCSPVMLAFVDHQTEFIRQSVDRSVAGATHCELPLRSKHDQTCAVWGQCELQRGETAEGALQRRSSRDNKYPQHLLTIKKIQHLVLKVDEISQCGAV